MKPTKMGIEKRLAEQEKGRQPRKPRRGLVVHPQPGETDQEAIARTLEQPEYARHKAAIAAGVPVPTVILSLNGEPFVLEETGPEPEDVH